MSWLILLAVVCGSARAVEEKDKDMDTNHIDYHTEPHYIFEYAVNDPHTGDIHSQKEERKGDVTQGEYSLVEADGTLRTVKYFVQGKSGFKATVVKAPISKHAEGVGSEVQYDQGTDGRARVHGYPPQHQAVYNPRVPYTHYRPNSNPASPVNAKPVYEDKSVQPTEKLVYHRPQLIYYLPKLNNQVLPAKYLRIRPIYHQIQSSEKQSQAKYRELQATQKQSQAKYNNLQPIYYQNPQNFSQGSFSSPQRNGIYEHATSRISISSHGSSQDTQTNHIHPHQSQK